MVSQLAKTLKGSEIIKIGNEVNELKKQGAKIANLTIGDFDPSIYPIPAKLKDNIIEQYNGNQTNYPPADGVAVLRENVSDLLKDRYQLNYSPNQILVAGGSRPLIYGAYLALVDPGDKVVYTTPSWNNNHYCHLAGAQGVVVPTVPENNFMPTAADIKPHLKGATMLALCSPLNPSGTMFAKKDLEAICDLVLEENQNRGTNEKPLYLLYDQIYALLTFGDNKHHNPVTLRPQIEKYTVYIDGASKCFAATGVRVGWSFGPEDIISKMRAILTHVGAWAPKAEQLATAKFLTQQDDLNSYLVSFKSKIQTSLDALHQGFQQLKAEGLAVDAIKPMGAIYLTVQVDYIGKTTPDGDLLKTSSDVNFYLIREAQIALVPFSAFGTDETINWFRASVGACSLEDITIMLPRLRSALHKLK